MLNEESLYLPKSDSDFMDLSDKMREAEITSMWIGVKAVWKLKWLNGFLYGKVLIVIIYNIFNLARFIVDFGFYNLSK